MTEESFFLTFHSNKYPICTQFNGIDKCSKQLYKDLVFSSDHTHIVNSDVSDVVFQSLVNYMNNGTLPQITKENYLEYLKINEEFQILTEFIKKSEEEFGTDFKCIVQLNDIKINQDNSFLENQIAKNLDLYLKQQFNQMKNLPFNCLCNIFNSPERKLEDQELAYHFIKDKSKDDPNFFVLLKSLEGDKLSRDSQIECERERVERFDFCPNNLSILSFKEHQEQLYESIKSIKEELNSLKISQKQNLEIISNQNQEIVDLKDIVAQLKTSLQDKDSCYLSYFGEKQGNYPYASLHVEANKETKLPFYHMHPSPNSIVSLEYNKDGTKITFKKSGMYLLMFNIMTYTVFQKNTKVRVYSTQGQHYSHYLNSYSVFHPNVSNQVISGYKLSPYCKDDYIYIAVSSDAAFDITGNSTVYTSFEIIKTQ